MCACTQKYPYGGKRISGTDIFRIPPESVTARFRVNLHTGQINGANLVAELVNKPFESRNMMLYAQGGAGKTAVILMNHYLNKLPDWPDVVRVNGGSRGRGGAVTCPPPATKCSSTCVQ